MTPRVQHALELAGYGWKVFPLNWMIGDRCSCGSTHSDGDGKMDGSRGKHPIKPGWQGTATSDPDVIKKLWKETPDANIGLACGEESNLIVLDIDDSEGEAIVAAKGHKPTVVSITGKGRQLFFKYPGEKVLNKVRSFPGLDSRGNGGYVVAPGSTHYSGKVYAFDADFHPSRQEVALAPQWWLDAVLASSSERPAQEKREEKPKVVKKGGRNSTLASMAGSLRDKGLSVETIRVALLDYNKSHCDPPLPEDEVANIAKSYGRYDAGDPNRKYTVSELADTLRVNRNFITSPIDSGGVGVQLMLYSDGVYKPNGADVARRMSDKILGKTSRPDTINSIVELIKERTKISDEFLNPRAQELVNTINGMYSWKEEKLYPHSAELLSTFQLNAVYDPEAVSGVLDTFLSQVLRPEDVLLMEEILGYLMIPTTKYQKAFMFVGEAANGKSTLLHMLSAFISEGNISRLSLQQLEDSPFSAAELQGKLINVYADIPAVKLEKSDVFKSIVSGDTIKAERKYGQPFILRTAARLMFSANEFPRSADSSAAYFRRWIIVNFPNRFEGKSADPDLSKKLTHPRVMSALLNRALTGLKRLEDQGHFSETESSAMQAEKYKTENNSSYAFIRDCLEKAPVKSVIPKSALFERYQHWCTENGIKFGESTQKFNKTIELALGVKEVRIGEKKIRNWAGVAFQGAMAAGPKIGASY